MSRTNEHHEQDRSVITSPACVNGIMNGGDCKTLSTGNPHQIQPHEKTRRAIILGGHKTRGTIPVGSAKGGEQARCEEINLSAAFPGHQGDPDSRSMIPRRPHHADIDLKNLSSCKHEWMESSNDNKLLPTDPPS